MSNKYAQKWDDDIQTLDEEYGEGFDPWEEGLVEDTEEAEPDEDDIFLQDSGLLGGKTSVSSGGKFLGEFSSGEEAEQAIKNWIVENEWYPNIWYVDDHGGISPYKLSD